MHIYTFGYRRFLLTVCDNVAASAFSTCLLPPTLYAVVTFCFGFVWYILSSGVNKNRNKHIFSCLPSPPGCLPPRQVSRPIPRRRSVADTAKSTRWMIWGGEQLCPFLAPSGIFFTSLLCFRVDLRFFLFSVRIPLFFSSHFILNVSCMTICLSLLPHGSNSRGFSLQKQWGGGGVFTLTSLVGEDRGEDLSYSS